MWICCKSCKTIVINWLNESSTCRLSRGDHINRMKKSIITFYLENNGNWKNQVFIPLTENKENNKQKQFQALIIDLIRILRWFWTQEEDNNKSIFQISFTFLLHHLACTIHGNKILTNWNFKVFIWDYRCTSLRIVCYSVSSFHPFLDQRCVVMWIIIEMLIYEFQP